VRADDLGGLADLAEREHVDVTIVGPEAPLAAGIVDLFEARGLSAFGPTRAAARIEASKAWTKDFLGRHTIPTASAEVVQSESAARRAIARTGLPIVLKADGLAAGKGVFVVTNETDLETALQALFHDQTLGAATEQVLVEQCLEGMELSVLAFTDGQQLAVMPPARDYKRLLDGDAGPNTGGMGGYTRPAYATDALQEEIERTILKPTVAGMASEGVPFRGVLYAGLMLTSHGPRVLEFNCRFGDPECQLIVPLLESNFSETCLQVVHNELRPEDLRWSAERTYGVVVAAAGYPARPRLGDAIDGLQNVGQDVLTFHAGTTRTGDTLRSSGGRVLTFVSKNRAAVYAAAAAVELPGKQVRTDIGVEVAEAVR
jgi:phosphoribosylamine--glycine ligase